jgi:hypothetical protein
MPTPQPIPLTPVRIAPGEPEYQSLLTWPFGEETDSDSSNDLNSNLLTRLLFRRSIVGPFERAVFAPLLGLLTSRKRFHHECHRIFAEKDFMTITI